MVHSVISLERTGSIEEIPIHSQSEYQIDQLVFEEARSRYKPGALQTILLDLPCTATASLLHRSDFALLRCLNFTVSY